eukprot:CAMPEP_0183702874 /NCGR_PEP_ID=MMETSP0737-20130205/835_1 /TAXON_ID=385413 /ORGANISM="Thalassiosira miniscula, Strain CCMP1093" /LENGTH=72 /DNA_ID=CAMNT_0025929557 /DNA_START=98 /DNA_END=316 /DNA_ORIENTATION=-
MLPQAKETDNFRPRSMSVEDADMFKSPNPFYDDSNASATTTPKSSPPSSPLKTASPEKEVLRQISMPEPFKI